MLKCYRIGIAPSRRDYENDGIEWCEPLFSNEINAITAAVCEMEENGFEFAVVQENVDECESGEYEERARFYIELKTQTN